MIDKYSVGSAFIKSLFLIQNFCRICEERNIIFKNMKPVCKSLYDPVYVKKQSRIKIENQI